MEIEFQNTKQDYIDFYLIQNKARFRKLVNDTLLLSIILAFSLWTFKFQWYNVLSISIGCFILLLILVYYVPFWIFIRRLNKKINTEGRFTEKRKWIAKEDGLEIESIANNFHVWGNIIIAKSNTNFVYLTLSDKKNLIIGKRWFSSQDQISEFIDLINSRINIGTPNFFINKSHRSIKSIKPRYLIGILCLIPLVGALIGFGMIMFGIFQYRDKWVVFIGAIGILVTVYFIKSNDLHSKSSIKNFAAGDKYELNDLVKQIEFYKLQNGVYPDSLKQIDVKGEMVIINDPILSLSECKNTLFNYHKIGKKYMLFSSGIDTIPNTADDIYPSLQIDTSKIGLIINRK